jgi:hypothetical protein
MFLSLPGEGAGRGEQDTPVLAASALDSADDDRPKGHLTLSHSSVQAFLLGRRLLTKPFLARSAHT